MFKKKLFYRYVNYKEHLESKILPRYSEWALYVRRKNKLPTHNQSTTSYVEYSFHLTKDHQFSRLGAFNLRDLLEKVLDDSAFYSRRLSVSFQ